MIIFLLDVMILCFCSKQSVKLISFVLVLFHSFRVLLSPDCLVSSPEGAFGFVLLKGKRRINMGQFDLFIFVIIFIC